MQPDPKDKSQNSDAPITCADDQEKREYYYDDAHGYETYSAKRDLAIYTIGHSTREFEEFVGLLTENNIGLLADVRSYPGSRKFPHFNKESLEITLPENGIRYAHLKQLGGRRKARSDSRNTVWRNEAFRGYADYMETAQFKEGIEDLIDLAEEERTAIMCSEAVWWRCHRSMISDYLKASGITVLHVMAAGKVEDHPYTAAANVAGGILSYSPAG